MEHTLILPTWTLFVAVIAWVATQVFTLWGAHYVVKRARDESVTQKDEVVGHFDEELSKLDAGEVEAQITRLDEALGGKFQEWDEAMRAMPASIAQALGSMKGVEMKALYADAVEGEEELEAYAMETVDPATIAMAKIEAIEPNADWQGKHPLGAMLIEAGKEFMRAKMDEARGVVTMKKVTSGEKPRGFR